MGPIPAAAAKKPQNIWPGVGASGTRARTSDRSPPAAAPGWVAPWCMTTHRGLGLSILMAAKARTGHRSSASQEHVQGPPGLTQGGQVWG